MPESADTFLHDWPLPQGVKVLITTRRGGISLGPYASLNLGMQVGDDPAAVAENRRRVREQLPGDPLWMNQVHGTRVVVIGEDVQRAVPPTADAATTRLLARPCAVMVADCLPILLCDESGSCVAAVHAGWRGLAAGVIEHTLAAMQVPPGQVMACFGPAIGPLAFEVGQDVVDAFAKAGLESKRAFTASADQDGKFLADIYELARQRLSAAGVGQVFGGGVCTLSTPARFFSYRRDGVTGRMAAFIWRE